MALSMSTTVTQVAALIREITGMQAVYSAASTDGYSIPMALNGPFPCVIVTPGPDSGSGYILSAAEHRHTYEVRAQFFEASEDVGQAAASALPFVDLFLSKFAANVTLGGRANSCRVVRQSGLIGLNYAGVDYTGYEITFEVSEQASVTAAPGS